MRVERAATSAGFPGGLTMLGYDEFEPRRRGVGGGVVVGAAIGVAVVLWWRAVLTIMAGVVAALMLMGFLRLASGGPAVGRAGEIQATLGVVLGLSGLIGGVIVAVVRSSGWWSTAWVLGGVAMGLIPFAFGGADPLLALVAAFLGGNVGMWVAIVRWAVSRRAPATGGRPSGGPDRSGWRRDAAAGRDVPLDHDPRAEAEFRELMRDVGLDEYDPGPGQRRN